MALLTHENIEDISLVRLDDGKANAMGPGMISEINRALDEVERESKAVLITGRPGLLSGGFDLKVIRSGDIAAVQSMANAGAKLLLRIYGFPKPVVIATAGHGVALGAFLLLAADYRLGVHGEYRIGLNEVGIGMTLPPFALMLAKSRLATHHITNAAINANMYDPESAKTVGFLDEVTSTDELMARSIEKTQELAKLDPAAFGQTKMDFRGSDIENIMKNLED